MPVENHTKDQLLLCVAIVLEMAALVTGFFGFNPIPLLPGLALLILTCIQLSDAGNIRDHDKSYCILAIISFLVGCIAVVDVLINCIPYFHLCYEDDEAKYCHFSFYLAMNIPCCLLWFIVGGISWWIHASRRAKRRTIAELPTFASTSGGESPRTLSDILTFKNTIFNVPRETHAFPDEPMIVTVTHPDGTKETLTTRGNTFRDGHLEVTVTHPCGTKETLTTMGNV